MVFCGFKTGTLLWLGLFLLAWIFLAVDVFSFGKHTMKNTDLPEEFAGAYGALGHYVVDATDSYGLFINLGDGAVFVDVKRDKFLELREQQALFLSQHTKELEINLAKFLDANPAYKPKRIAYIGLHAKTMEQGEIFWNPDGYTRLIGTDFLLE